MKKKLLVFFLMIISLSANSQVDVALYKQFNGRYDFTFVGNTLNLKSNGANTTPCTLLTTSSQTLNLPAANTIESAYLYWAGSGTGDLDIKLNGQNITAERTFDVIFDSAGDNISRPFFSAFADVSAIVKNQGNGTYTVSDLDLTNVINEIGQTPAQNIYCKNGTNFGGWAIVIIYENNSFALNQINVYDGLQFVPDEVNITLDNLNVYNSIGAKTGFIAWEGDSALDDGESLKINGSVLSNTLNPPTNAFNSTNTVTGSSNLYNMDLDIYNVEDYIIPGNPTADIQLTSDADFVMINVIITRLNSISPDATITIDDEFKDCVSHILKLDYTIHNDNATDVLPAGTIVAVYLDGDLITTFTTQTEIAINGSESGTLTIPLPANLTGSVQLLFVVDDDGTGTGAVIEIDESNNSYVHNTTLWALEPIKPADITECETASNTNVGIFDFSDYEQSLKTDPAQTVTFYHTEAGAQAENAADQITTTSSYLSTQNPETIYVRLDDPNGCSAIAPFNLITIDCTFPDGTIIIDTIVTTCDSKILQVTYTINNFDSFDILPANTPVAIYANGILLATTTTSADIAIGGSLTANITITIPGSIPQNFNLTFVIDDTGTGIGIVVETNETNNSFTTPFTLWVSPVLPQPEDIGGCETFNGSGIGEFDFSAYAESLKINPTDVVTFHISQQDAEDNTDAIAPTGYNAPSGTEIFVRLTDSNGCYDMASFLLEIIDCYFPDATVIIDDVYKQCNSRILHIHYTVSNLNGTDILPALTPVAIYANGQLITVTKTIGELAIGESEPGFIEVTVPIGIPLDFELGFTADDIGNGTGIVIELDETNNGFIQDENLPLSPELIQPDDIEECDKGFGLATFDFSHYAEKLKNYPNETVTFYRTQPNTDQDLNRIYNIANYSSDENPTRIYVRLDNGTCHTTASFLLRTKKCKPVTHNYLTPNGDGYNDEFFVEGLRNIFLNFKMSIYNRWGTLIWTGDHSRADWNGIADVAKVGSENLLVPEGTYYFVLELNDPDFPDPIVDWVYVTK